MNMLLNSQIIPMLEMYLSEVTDRQIDREGSRHDKIDKGDKEIGTLDSEVAKRLWCVARVLKAKAVETSSKAVVAPDDHSEESLKSDEVETLAS